MTFAKKCNQMLVLLLGLCFVVSSADKEATQIEKAFQLRGSPKSRELGKKRLCDRCFKWGCFPDVTKGVLTDERKCNRLQCPIAETHCLPTLNIIKRRPFRNTDVGYMSKLGLDAGIDGDSVSEGDSVSSEDGNSSSGNSVSEEDSTSSEESPQAPQDSTRDAPVARDGPDDSESLSDSVSGESRDSSSGNPVSGEEDSSSEEESPQAPPDTRDAADSESAENGNSSFGNSVSVSSMSGSGSS